MVQSIPGFMLPVFASATHALLWHCATGAHSSSLLHESPEKIGDLTALPGTAIVDALPLGAVSPPDVEADVEGAGGVTSIGAGALFDATGLTGEGAPEGHAASKPPTATIAAAETIRVMFAHPHRPYRSVIL
jgi:hypothetical protein